MLPRRSAFQNDNSTVSIHISALQSFRQELSSFQLHNHLIKDTMKRQELIDNF